MRLLCICIVKPKSVSAVRMARVGCIHWFRLQCKVDTKTQQVDLTSCCRFIFCQRVICWTPEQREFKYIKITINNLKMPIYKSVNLLPWVWYHLMQIQDNFQMDEMKQHSQHLCVLKKMERTNPWTEAL